MSRKPTEYQHNDHLGQAIHPGQQVAFSYSASPGIRVGTVQRLTRMKVRVSYYWRYTYPDGRVSEGHSNYLANPDQILVLGDGLPAELTMLALKNQL